MSDEYPKWLAAKGVVAQSKDEEDALSDGRAEVVLAHRSAEGDTYKIAYKPAAPAPKPPEPETVTPPEAEAMLAQAQETFTRRKSSRKGR